MNWPELLLTHNAAVLPSAWALQSGRAAGWALVLACAGMALVRRQALPVRLAVAVALVVWACVPGEMSPTFWLGLAFQSPSLLAVGVCMAWLVRNLVGDAVRWDLRGVATGGWQRSALRQRRVTTGFVWAGVGLGYLLLLDTLGLLPVQMYAWGFGPLALGLVLAVSLVPWVAGVRGALAWAAPLAVVVFALTRLPSGNVWDAVLDPITWTGLHLVLLVRARAR
jgi:hypothetical protein